MNAIVAPELIQPQQYTARTHSELASVLRYAMSERKTSYTYKQLAEKVNVSYNYLHLFHKKGRNVCIVIMNRLARYFDVRYEIKNYHGPSLMADAIGIHELRKVLRQRIELEGENKIRTIARAATEIAINEGLSESTISYEWLRLFYLDKQEPCFIKMHGVAQYFGIRYIIRNFSETQVYEVA